MRTVFQGNGRGTGFWSGARLQWTKGRCLNTILAIVVGAGTILALTGCRSREYPGSAHGPVYPGDPSSTAMGGTYYPPGYPTGPQQRSERDPRNRTGNRNGDRTGNRGWGKGRHASPDGSSYWNGDHLSGNPSIRIDLRTQRAYFFKGTELAGVSPVSSGRPGYDTPAGSFRITQKSPQHRSNLYGDFVDAEGTIVKANVDIRRDEAPPGTKYRGASMPHFLRFNDAVGMHGGYLPGYPASSGCVRLPEEMARHFFANAPEGTPVVVVR